MQIETRILRGIKKLKKTMKRRGGNLATATTATTAATTTTAMKALDVGLISNWPSKPPLCAGIPILQNAGWVPISIDGGRGQSVVTNNGSRIVKAADEMPVVIGGLKRYHRSESIYQRLPKQRDLPL